MALRTKTVDTRNGPLRYWQVMVDLTLSQGGFTLPEVHGLQNGRNIRVVKQYLAACRQLGAVEIIGEVAHRNPVAKLRYRVVDLSAKAPVVRRDSFKGERGRVTQNLWNAMRQLKQFTVAELAYAATTEEVEIQQNIARDYVNALGKVGMLAKITAANPRAGVYAVWRLMPQANTGPRAPSISKDGVFDINLQQVVRVNSQPSLKAGRAA